MRTLLGLLVLAGCAGSAATTPVANVAPQAPPAPPADDTYPLILGPVHFSIDTGDEYVEQNFGAGSVTMSTSFHGHPISIDAQRGRCRVAPGDRRLANGYVRRVAEKVECCGGNEAAGVVLLADNGPGIPEELARQCSSVRILQVDPPTAESGDSYGDQLFP